MIRQLSEASFAMDDVLLFLDTHPGHPEAMEYLRNMAAARKAAIQALEKQGGLLFAEDQAFSGGSWVTERWPWEGGC